MIYFNEIIIKLKIKEKKNISSSFPLFPLSLFLLHCISRSRQVTSSELQNPKPLDLPNYTSFSRYWSRVTIVIVTKVYRLWWLSESFREPKIGFLGLALIVRSLWILGRVLLVELEMVLFQKDLRLGKNWNWSLVVAKLGLSMVILRWVILGFIQMVVVVVVLVWISSVSMFRKRINNKFLCQNYVIKQLVRAGKRESFMLF